MNHAAYRPFLLFLCALAIIIALIPWYSHHLQLDALKQSELGDQADSLHIAESAVNVNPASVKARFVLAGAQHRLGREAEARKTLIRAIALQPLNYETWRQLAIYERDYWGEPAAAREHFAVAISLSPYDDHLQVEAGVKSVEDLS